METNVTTARTETTVFNRWIAVNFNYLLDMSSFVHITSSSALKFVLRSEHETLGSSYTKLMRKEMVEINIFPDMSQDIWWLILAADVCISLQAKPCQKNNKTQKKLTVLPDLNEWERRSLSCRTKVMFIKLLNQISFFSSALFLPAFVRLSSVYCKIKVSRDVVS